MLLFKRNVKAKCGFLSVLQEHFSDNRSHGVRCVGFESRKNLFREDGVTLEGFDVRIIIGFWLDSGTCR